MDTIGRFQGIVAVALVLTSVSTATAKYSGGSGTAQDPYQIATAADLIALGETPADYDKHFVLTADIDLDPNLPGRKVFDKAVVAPDLDETKYGFQGTPFAGVFDGNGHTISHLMIRGGRYLGLFGRLESGAEVKDLGVVDITIIGSGDDVGGLVGDNRWGSVTRCYSTGTVSGNYEVGGLVGWNLGTVSQCYSTAAVDGVEDVGGLVGLSGDPLSGAGNITDSYSIGVVTGEDCAGGLVGFSDGYVTGFWDTQTSGQAKSSGGTGKTTAEMQDPNTFRAAGWDFVGQADGPHDIWAEPKGRGYPILWWQLSSLPSLPGFSGGTGEPNDPYLISKAEDLNHIGHNPRLMKCHFKLVADLDLTGFHFYPIGGADSAYGGVFDGNGHTISHVTIKGERFLGVFGYLASGAEVKGLGVVDVKMTGSREYGGALVGRNNGDVTECYSTGTVSGGECQGGLVGWNNGDVTHCYSTAAVSGRSSVGGLVGWNRGTVTQCYSTGTVGETDAYGATVAGLVGWNDGTVTHCYSTGAVKGNNDVGGLVGWNGGTVTYCYSTGAVSATGQSWGVGGLVGVNYAVVAQCYSNGPVTGDSCVGGLVGQNKAGGVTDSYSTGVVTGNASVGGLVGTNTGTVTRCYSTGTASGSNWSVGGLMGKNRDDVGRMGIVMSCFWDTQASGQAASAAGTGKVTGEMHTAKTFLDAGWDFVGETKNGTEDLWWIVEGKDYPHLCWEAAKK